MCSIIFGIRYFVYNKRIVVKFLNPLSFLNYFLTHFANFPFLLVPIGEILTPSPRPYVHSSGCDTVTAAAADPTSNTQGRATFYFGHSSAVDEAIVVSVVSIVAVPPDRTLSPPMQSCLYSARPDTVSAVVISHPTDILGGMLLFLNATIQDTQMDP